MDQPDIAPLARRLAEENNVDWRRLRGSGDHGRVVERDVLEYLARVMAGDEAVDPTPEPVPEGMRAWPEADVRAGSVEAAREEVELTSTIEDDIFLFDEGDPASADADADDDDDDDDDDDVRHAFGGGTHPAPPPPPASTAGAGAVFDRFDTPTGSDPSDDDDLEEDLLIAGDADPQPTVADDATVDEPVTVASDPALPDLFGAADDAPRDDHATPDLFAEEEPGVVGGDAGWLGGPELSDEDDGEGAGTGARGFAYDGVPSFDEDADDDADVATDHPDPYATDGDRGTDLDTDVEDDLVHEFDGMLDEPQRDPTGGPSVVAAPALGAAAPPVAGPQDHAPVDAFSDVPLLRHGHVWRRQVDLSALVAAQADLAADLGRTELVPLAAFLVRASQKALAARGGAVALARLEADSIVCLKVDAEDDFATTVRAVERVLEADGGGSREDVDADLVVVDLSEFGVDDAVVRVGAPALTLGRVLIDNQSGGRRAYLAMSGDGADGSEAAQLLARVAEMLEAPVRVVV